MDLNNSTIFIFEEKLRSSPSLEILRGSIHWIKWNAFLKAKRKSHE